MGTRTRSPSKSAAPDTLSREAYLRAALQQLHRDIDDAKKDRSHQAVAALRLRALNVRDQLDAELKAAVALSAEREADPYAGLADEQLVEKMRALIAELPDALLGEIEEALAVRRGGPPALRVVR